MSVLRRALPFACLLALLVPVAAAALPADPAAVAAKKGKAKKNCPKGFKAKTVTRKGKKVKVCRKVNGTGGGGSGGGSAGLFEAPGQKLEGAAAKPFLEKYLVNSTFTDCPPGWPNCAVEQRYSHWADSSFYYCRLTSVSGADITVSDEYGVEGAVVEPDGSWTFREVVYNHGNYSHYEWRVAPNGVVNGAYQFTPTSSIEQIGPLQYLHTPKNCSY